MQKRGKKPFLGGIHPTDGFDKALTMEKAVQEYSPLKVTILSEQSPGGRCRFTVQPGDKNVQMDRLVSFFGLHVKERV